MTSTTYLTNHFLIAMPTLMDPNFFHSVTYICEHNEEGAMGIVINQPADINLGDLAEHLKLGVTEKTNLTQPIYSGGPVEIDRGFVLHRPVGKWESTLDVADGIAVSTSTDIVTALAAGEGPAESLIALGYAGWGAGQLERELADNAWLSGPADARIIFDTKNEERWNAAARLLGVDINQISGDIGHA
jgi:putative transcriptional regulator